MKCPDCEQAIRGNALFCDNCGYDLNSIPWLLLAKAYPPSDLVIESLLRSYGIPVKLIRKDIPQVPVTIGPLAEVRILVPAPALEEAQALLAGLEESKME